LQSYDVLLTTAELAVALVGFAGIVVAFQRRGSEPWGRTDLARFWQMIVLAAFALVFSLLPLPFISAGRSETTIWATCSALMATLVGLEIATFTYVLLRRHQVDPHVSAPLSYYMLATSIAAFGALLANAFGILFEHSFTGYFLGILYLIGSSVVFFARLVYFGLAGPSRHDP
jgi:hypothetical protein